MSERGFSLLETTIALALSLMVSATVFSVMHPSSGLFASQLESADLQQRLRVGADVLARALRAAGAGAYAGQQNGPLVMYFPPVQPSRQGARAADPAGTFAADRITVLSVPATSAQTVLSQELTPANPAFSPAPLQDGSCGADDPLCGFSIGSTVLVFDDSGNHDLFTIVGMNGATFGLSLARSTNAMTTTYPAGSKVVEVESHTYYLKPDILGRTGQLMHYDGTGNPDAPIVDHVVGLTFEYAGEAEPPTMTKPLADISPPQTTYGAPPRHPPASYGAGESCLFVNDGSGTPAPRLPTLGIGTLALVPLTAAQLTDGPWCPEDSNPNRWDADLLRIRRIGVTLRVQSASAALRGPAGVLFSNSGTSTDGRRRVPDLEIRLQVSPPNLNPGR